MNTRFASLGVGLLAGGLLAAAPVLSEDLVRPGMWEIISTMTMAKKPGNAPETRQNHCYRASDVAGVNEKSSALTTNSAADQKCTVKDVKYAGNKGTWSTVCANGMTIHSDMTFHGDAFEGVIQMDVRGDAMTVHMRAKRTGECR